MCHLFFQRKVSRYAVGCAFILFLTACSEPESLPNNITKITTGAQLPTPTPITPNPPPNSEGITPSIQWSLPIDVLNTVGQPGYDNIIEGPTLLSDNLANAYFSIRKLRLINAIDNVYAKGRNVVLQQLDTGSWGPTYPVPSDVDSQASSIVLSMAQQTGDLFGAWTIDNQLYVNHMSRSNIWSVPQQVASDVATFHLLISPNGAVTIIWTPLNPIANNIFLKRASAYDNATIHFQPQENLSLPTDIRMAKPIIDLTGNVTVAWLADEYTFDGNIDYRKIAMQINRPNTGWNTVGTEQKLPQTYQQYDSLIIAPDLTDTVITIIYPSALDNKIISNHFIPTTGWGNFETLDTSNYTPIRPPQLISNTSGNALIFWIAEEYASPDFHTHHILSNRYSTMPDSDDEHWGDTVTIGSTLHPNSFYSPKIVLTTQGAAIATWIENGLSGSTLYTNTYQPASSTSAGTNWSTSPDVLLSTQSENTIIRDVDLSINALGEATIVWKTLVGGQLGGEYHFYVSKQTLTF